MSSTASRQRPDSRRTNGRTQSKPTVLSAFSGAGGLDLGLERAGFHSVACIEIDESARKTLRANRPECNLLDEGNIIEVAKTLAPRQLGLRQRELGLLAGGPPCQPFSKAAQWSDRGRAGLSDPRSFCLGAFLELLERFLPTAMLIENVPGFVLGKTSAVPLINSALDGINSRNKTKYRLAWQVLNAADYGVPQRRQRAILIARRDGGDPPWPEPTHVGRHVRAWDAICDLVQENVPKATGYWSGLLPSVPEGKNYMYHTPGGGGLPLFGRRRWYWTFLLKLAKEAPAWTLSGKPGPSTGPFHWDNRPLTIAEMLCIQSFPAEWQICGGTTRQTLQVGNATPPLLAECLGRALGEKIFGLAYEGRPTLSIARKRVVPPAAPVGEVPEAYKKHLNSQEDHPGEGKGPGASRRQAQMRSSTELALPGIL